MAPPPLPLGKANVADRSAARSELIPPLPWPTFSPALSTVLLHKRVNSVAIDISMIRPPFGRVVSANVSDLSAHRVSTHA
jgi:hypothetical protein